MTRQISMRALLVAASVLLTSILFAQQQTVITGKLLGYDKKPMLLAHVHLIKAPASEAFDRVEAGKDGSFRIATPETGLIVAEFTGVNHAAFDVPLLIERPTTIDINVSLATYSYFDDPKEIKMLSDVTDFDFNRAQPMKKQPDGTFTLVVNTKRDTLAYQVFGAEKNNRAINGTQSDRFEFDGAGDYRSIVNVGGGSVRVVFDPKKTLRSSAIAEFKFSDPSSTVAKIAVIQQEMSRREIVWSGAVATYVRSGKDFRTFAYDWSSDQASVLARLKSEKSPLARQMLLMAYIDMKAKNAANADPAIGSQLFREVPPDSKLWMMPTLPVLNAAAELSGDEQAYEEYLGRFLEKNPQVELKTNLIMGQLVSARMKGDAKRLKFYYDMAMKYFAGTPFGNTVQQQFTPTIAIEVGKPAPAFRVRSLDDTTKVYTNETFRGKFVLLDFWATWCAPCVAEMENLHTAYDRFRTKDFEILSLSLDQKPGDVIAFRRDKWKMPWAHSFVTNNNALTTAFEVVAIPRPVLIDKSGTIVALEGDLRGDQLEATLSKFLDQPK